jgi:hypothetical protein
MAGQQLCSSARVQGSPANPRRSVGAGDSCGALSAVLLEAQSHHRLFPHITRACQGVVFHSVAIAQQFMARATTATGLKVTVDILTGVYATGKKCATDFLETMRIVFDDFLPRWNYRAIPQKT